MIFPLNNNGISTFFLSKLSIVISSLWYSAFIYFIFFKIYLKNVKVIDLDFVHTKYACLHNVVKFPLHTNSSFHAIMCHSGPT